MPKAKSETWNMHLITWTAQAKKIKQDHREKALLQFDD